jgi:hypothetical protein
VEYLAGIMTVDPCSGQEVFTTVSRRIGDALPDQLVEALAGTDLAGQVGRTYALLTADERGDVSVALLSAGEVIATDDRRLRIALWPGTTTTRNLQQTGRGTLASIEPEGSYYIRLEARRAADLQAASMNHAVFDAHVTDVLSDDVSYAAIVSGIRFDLKDPAAVVGRWQSTVDALRRSAV